MKLLIGCPVSKREWILQKWKEHVEVACKHIGVDPDYTFVIAPDDKACIDMALEWGNVTLSDESPREDKRTWGEGSIRYHEMVSLRNVLLNDVRTASPDVFLSLDSDILLHPYALVGLLEVLKSKPAVAVGGKTFMTEYGESYPSYGDTLSLRRSACVEVRRVSVIMACKAMTPAAYNVDYEFHPNGEDVGWSAAVARSGGKLWWDGRVASKHVMKPYMLEKIDDRCGF